MALQPSKADIEKERSRYQQIEDESRRELRELEIKIEQARTRIEIAHRVLVTFQDFYGPAE